MLFSSSSTSTSSSPSLSFTDTSYQTRLQLLLLPLVHFFLSIRYHLVNDSFQLHSQPLLLPLVAVGEVDQSEVSRGNTNFTCYCRRSVSASQARSSQSSYRESGSSGKHMSTKDPWAGLITSDRQQ
eukprot:761254-Hanusia_phi.AAC.6